MAFHGKNTLTFGVSGLIRSECVCCIFSTILRSAFAAAFGKNAGSKFSANVKTIEPIKDMRRKFAMLSHLECGFGRNILDRNDVDAGRRWILQYIVCD